jgi:hypothetical protein
MSGRIAVNILLAQISAPPPKKVMTPFSTSFARTSFLSADFTG